MASKELQNIIKQKLDNPIDINLSIELRRKQLQDNAIPPPAEAIIEKENVNPTDYFFLFMEEDIQWDLLNHHFLWHLG